MKPVVFHDQAEADMEEAAAWYDHNRPGLGREFLNAVESAVHRVGENPQAGPFYGSKNFRYVLTRRFPYVVFYTESEQTVWVMAVAHGSRKPGYWKNRKIT